LPFPIRLENPHVISPAQARRRMRCHPTEQDSSRHLQVWIGTLNRGPTGRALNSSYRTRDTPEYKSELGEAIINCVRVVPDGVLVFFASYAALAACVDSWQTGSSPTVWCVNAGCAMSAAADAVVAKAAACASEASGGGAARV
jgi:regulator of telomere elongation helicase 1